MRKCTNFIRIVLNKISVLCMDEKEKRELNLKRLEVFSHLLHDSVFERYKLLPQISALSATLLVVATFNESLVPLTNFVRVLLIILLTLIPVSLIGYIFEISRSEKHSSENIERLGNGQEPIQQNRNLYTAYLPCLVVASISMVIICIILSIVRTMCNF